LDIGQIKKELDTKRAGIKNEFERRIQEFEKNVEYNREKINAYKKKKPMDIARIEQNFNKKTVAILKKRLGEKIIGNCRNGFWKKERILKFK
jgi:hypothetical protein